MESQNRLSSPNQRWTTIVSLTLQCLLVAAIIALPLFHPEALPFRVGAPNITLPLKPLPQPVPRVDATSAASTSAATSSNAQLRFTDMTHIPTPGQPTSDAVPTLIPIGTGMSDPTSTAMTLANATSNGPRISVAPDRPVTARLPQISTGVSNGLLLAPITPIYPRIAITAHIDGTVRVEAIISKSGQIESAHVVSGPAMLRQAALDAVRNARYRPYLLNGSPIEVETAITVNFKLSN